MDAISAGREDQDQAQVAPIPQAETAKVNKPLAGILRRFADAYIKLGDVTKAYLLTHKDCKSANQAKTRGRVLLRDPRLVAYCQQVRSQALVSTDTSTADPAKMEWENELRSVAFASFNAKKVPVKEKVSALRTLGESKGWLKQQQQGAGLRATFNFHVGGRRQSAQGRTITVDVGEGSAAGSIDAPGPVESIPVGAFGVDLDSDSPQTSSALRSNPTKDVVFDLSSESESESESGPPSARGCLTERGQLTVNGARPAVNGAQSRSQVLDSTDSTPKQAGKAGNTGGLAPSRSTPTGRPGASDSRQLGRKGLFDASNT